MTPARYVAWLDLRAGTGVTNNINRNDPVTQGLNQVILASSGVILKAKDGTTKITPLLFTTSTGSETDANKLRMQPDVLGLLREYKPGNEQLNLAVRINGKVKTAFPDGASFNNPTPLRIVMSQGLARFEDVIMWYQIKRDG